jgi:predicted RecA/RadA family phage recombinase
LTLVAPYAVTTGHGFKVGSIFAVATTTAGIGAEVEGKTIGVFDILKDGTSLTAGQVCY